jgi:hypothetical protein
MPRIDTINAEVGLQGGAAPRVQADTSMYTAGTGLGRAVAGVGEQMGQIAQRAFALEDQQKRFDLATLDDERKQKLATALQEAQQNMPVAGRDFHKTYMEKAQAINAEYGTRMQAINPKIAAQYQQRWQGGEGEEWSRRAAGVEQKAGSEYYRGELNRRADALLTTIKQSPDPKTTDAQLQRWKDEFLAAAPYLSPAEKAVVLEKTRQIIEAQSDGV